MKLNKAIFYIKYFAKKHDCEIERKATLDEDCFGVNIKNSVIHIKYMLMLKQPKNEIMANLNTEQQPINGR